MEEDTKSPKKERKYRTKREKDKTNEKGSEIEKTKAKKEKKTREKSEKTEKEDKGEKRKHRTKDDKKKKDRSSKKEGGSKKERTKDKAGSMIQPDKTEKEEKTKEKTGGSMIDLGKRRSQRKQLEMSTQSTIAQLEELKKTESAKTKTEIQTVTTIIKEKEEDEEEDDDEAEDEDFDEEDDDEDEDAYDFSIKKDSGGKKTPKGDKKGKTESKNTKSDSNNKDNKPNTSESKEDVKSVGEKVENVEKAIKEEIKPEKEDEKIENQENSKNKETAAPATEPNPAESDKISETGEKEEAASKKAEKAAESKEEEKTTEGKVPSIVLSPMPSLTASASSPVQNIKLKTGQSPIASPHNVIEDIKSEQRERRSSSDKLAMFFEEKKTTARPMGRERANTAFPFPLARSASNLETIERRGLGNPRLLGKSLLMAATKPKKEEAKKEEIKISAEEHERYVSMVDLLFNSLIKNGVLPEPYCTAKKLFGEKVKIEEIAKALTSSKLINISYDDEDDTSEGSTGLPLDEADDDIDLIDNLQEYESKFLPKEPSKFIEYEDEWRGRSAAGCFNYPTWRNNPQYVLYIKKTANVEITLTQSDMKPEIYHIGFYVFQGNQFIKRVIEKDEMIEKCSLEDQITVSITVKLTGSTTPYMIIPCTFDPGEQTDFKLSVKLLANTNDVLSFYKLLPSNDWIKNIVKGKWGKSNAGGCRNFSTHLLNDQFLISLPNGGKCNGKILLQTGNGEEIDELGLYLLSPPKGLAHKVVHLLDAPLLSKSGFNLPNEAILDFRIDAENEQIVIIPCTFEAQRYSSYKMFIFSDQPINITPLSPPKYKEIPGSWEGESAVGCINHPLWRYNPQYSLSASGKVQIQLQKTEEKPDVVIGFYILKGISGERQLEINKDNFLSKAAFVNSQSVFAELESSELTNYTIVPCTFKPGLECKFILRAFCNSADASDLQLLPAPSDWVENKVSHKWQAGTSGGCINYATWRNNPQIRMKVEEDGEVMLILEQQQIPEQAPISIGFYITTKSANNQRTWTMAPADILCKAPFRKATTAMCKFTAKKGVEYNIIACSFSPWDERSFHFYAYGYKQKVYLKRLHRSKKERELRIHGRWDSQSAGGCMKNTSWPKNPHLLLYVKDKPVTMEIILQQQMNRDDTADAIGFCVTESNEQGFPKISSIDDIKYKANYEEARDISLSCTLNPSPTPYVITPSTYHPGLSKKFVLQIFTDADSNIILSDPHQNYEFNDNEFEFDDAEDEILPAAEPSALTTGKERIEETTEDAEQLTEQVTYVDVVQNKIKEETEVKAQQSAEQVATDNAPLATAPGVPPPPPPPGPPPPPIIPATGLSIAPVSRPVLSKPSSGSSGTALLDQIRVGTSLKSAAERELKAKSDAAFSWTPFNIDKIVARRAALECSDDEGDAAEEWDDDWD